MNIAGYQIASQLVEEYLSVDKVERIMLTLRDVGTKARYILRKSINEEMMSKKQFMVAMLALSVEIRNEDYSCIDKFNKYLENLEEISLCRISQRFLFKDRIVVLLNAPWSNAHGEARFLDPDGRILSGFVDKRYSCFERRERISFLTRMQRNFCYRFDHENSIILIFSFFIPCTLPAFMCSNLIGEFASRWENTMIIAYETVFRKTNMYLARAFMNQKNIYILRVPKLERQESFKNDRSKWRQCCNGNWVTEDCGLYKFLDNVHSEKASRKLFRRRIRTNVNQMVTRWIPSDDDNYCSDDENYTFIDTLFEDKLSTIYDYCRIFKKMNTIKGKRKTKLGIIKNNKYKKQRQKKNYYESFWSLD